MEGELLDLVKQRTTLYREMQAISAEQLQVCKENDFNSDLMGGLNTLINRRQALMDQIDEVNKALNSLRESKSDRGLVFAKQIFEESMSTQEAREQQAIAATISKNDEVCLTWLQNKSAEVASIIKENRANRVAFEAYKMPGAPNGGWFIDKKR